MLTTRSYLGENLPSMSVSPPIYKPQSDKQRGIQPDKTKASQNQWFTKSEVAKKLIETTRNKMRVVGKNWGDYYIVEPSAGDGRFLDFLQSEKRIGIDLYPQRKDIVKSDFLTWQPTKKGKYVVIGNPPFGVRGDLAEAFIQRSCLFADVCAFILPIGFLDKKRSYFPGFDLVHSEELPPDTFVNILGHESRIAGQGTIITCFNVWMAGNSKPPINYNYICKNGVSVSLCYFPKSSEEFIATHDLFIKARYYGEPKVSEEFSEVTSRKSYYVVGISVKENKRAALSKLKNINWKEFSKKETNGSFSVSLKKAMEALYSVNLAERI